MGGNVKTFSSPKEALLSYKRIDVIGRGRISRDNNAWLDEMIAKGEFAVSGMNLKASSGPTPAPPTVERTKVETGIADVRQPTRDITALEAYVGDIKTGMKAVCDNCRSSLTYCPCESPRVMVDGTPSVVHFKPRTRPLPTFAWS